ncbi:MAG: hypothetical protein IT444_13990 [Phycisphaeraceae bacterium]|nr:hypothetical protein [Phycisphaeraceae bacterium]
MSATPLLYEMAGRRSVLPPLDAAIDYLRQRPMRVLPAYVMAIAPMSVCVFLLIDAITSGHRSALPEVVILFMVSFVWRWGWLGFLQRRIQVDLRGEPPLPLRKRIVPIIFTRILALMGMTWGSFLIVPSILGFYLSGLVTPSLLERSGPATKQLMETGSWLTSSGGRMTKLTGAIGVIAMLVWINVTVIQTLVVNMLIPTLAGLDVNDLRLTLSSPAWFFFLQYLLFLVFDLLWAVAAVMLFYDLQSRRLGSDLRRRLQAYKDAAS